VVSVQLIHGGVREGNKNMGGDLCRLTRPVPTKGQKEGAGQKKEKKKKARKGKDVRRAKQCSPKEDYPSKPCQAAPSGTSPYAETEGGGRKQETKKED